MILTKPADTFRMTAAVAGLLFAAACPTALPLPELTLESEAVYPGPEVTLSFTASATGSGYSYGAVLSQSDGMDYLEVGSIPIEDPVEGVGSVALGALQDGAYRLVLSVSEARGLGSYEVAYLTRTAYFLVDTASPGPPAASVEAGSRSEAFEVFLSHAELSSPSGSSVAIYYTTDGSDPSSASTRYEVGFPIPVSASLELRALAVDSAGNASTVASWEYLFPPPEAPTVTAITPATLNVDAGDEATLRIEGTGFGASTTVAISSPGVVESVYVASATLLYAVVDVSSLSAGSLAVTITTEGGTATDSTSVTLVESVAPVVTGITPATLNIDTDDDATLTITGSGFGADATVSISSPGVVKSAVVASAIRIYASVDVTAMSTGTLTVTVNAVGGSSSGSVTLVQTPPPAITGITPATLNVDTDDNATLTIGGSGFASNSAVTISAGVVESVYVASATQIFAIVDVTGAATGAFDVTVTTAGGSDTDSASVTLVPMTPVVSALGPGTGDISADSSLTIEIYGSGFVPGGSTVVLQDSASTPATVLGVSVVSPTFISLWVNLTVGGLIAGNGSVVVTNPSGATGSAIFTLIP